MTWTIFLPFVTVIETLYTSSFLSVKEGRKNQQERPRWGGTLIWTEGKWKAWPDLKASTIVPETQVLAEPESCLPKELGNSQNPTWMKTNTSLVFVIHFCSAHHAALP